MDLAELEAQDITFYKNAPDEFFNLMNSYIYMPKCFGIKNKLSFHSSLFVIQSFTVIEVLRVSSASTHFLSVLYLQRL